MKTLIKEIIEVRVFRINKLIEVSNINNISKIPLHFQMEKIKK